MELNWKEIARDDTNRNVHIEMNKIADNYMKLYDEYYETGSRNSAFLKDLVDSIINISAILETYNDLGDVNADYVLTRLNNIITMVNSVKEFYEYKKRERNEDDK